MKNILVVDDDDILRMLICDTLEDLNYEIDEVENGIEALEKINQQTYDLIILDYMMPQLTGIEVIERIPNHIKANTPILMLTAKAQETDRKAVLEKGARFFIPKPFSPVELVKFVEMVLSE